MENRYYVMIISATFRGFDVSCMFSVFRKKVYFAMETYHAKPCIKEDSDIVTACLIHQPQESLVEL